MVAWSAPASVAVLAFVTSVHAGFVVLRRHRSTGVGGRFLLLLPALVFAASPWFFPTGPGLAIGLACQLAWFVACEKLTGASPTRPSGREDPADGRPRAQSRSREFVPLAVLAVHEETETIRTFRLARPADFDFTSGQFLTVRVDVGGKAYARCYSISSAPGSTGYLEISVRRQGIASDALHASCRPGSVLFARPPAGRFVYPAGDERPLVLLAGGVGITPLLSMLRHAVAVDPHRPVTLLLSCRSEREVPFRDEIEVLAARHPQVRVTITVSGPPPEMGSGPLIPGASRGPAPLSGTPAGVSWRRGRIDHALIREAVPVAAAALFYVCGPTPMMEAMRALLDGEGVPAAQVRTEVFQPAAAIGAATAVQGQAAGVQASKVVCTVSNQVLHVPAGVTLLEAADAAGVPIPSLCRSGVCGTCRTRLLSGNVRCTSDALDEADRANGYVLPCVTWPAGDCALEA